MLINPVKLTKCWLNYDFIHIYKLNIQYSSLFHFTKPLNCIVTKPWASKNVFIILQEEKPLEKCIFIMVKLSFLIIS